MSSGRSGHEWQLAVRDREVHAVGGGGIVTAFAAQDPLLQGASVQYYWIAGSNLPYQVQCTVTVAGGPPIVLIAAIRVNTPALTLSAQTTTLTDPVDVRPYQGLTKQLQFGTDTGTGTQHGIAWTVNGLSVAGSEAGSVQVVDLCNSYTLRTMKNGTKTVKTSSGRYLLDDMPGNVPNPVPVGGVVMAAGPSAANRAPRMPCTTARVRSCRLPALS